MRVRRLPASVLPRIAGEAWVDPDRRAYLRDGIACVPVRDGCPADEDLPERRAYRGRGYHLIGDVAVVHGDAPTKEEIEAIVAHRHPRGVVWLKGCTGAMRIPEAVVVYGSAGEVRHREQGCTFILDPTRVMFAQGNRVEKARIAALVRPGERIADMFAGIGYFTIPAARSGARIHAMEINPIAFDYLRRGIAANSVADRVTPMMGDCRGLLSGVYDRILMGHFEAASFLPDALAHVRPGSVIHVHSIGGATAAIQERLMEAGLSAAISSRRVKKYGPHRWHMVQDVRIE